MDKYLAVGIGLLVLAGQFTVILWSALVALREETRLRWRAFVELEKLRCGRLSGSDVLSQAFLKEYLKLVSASDECRASSLGFTLGFALIEARKRVAALPEAAGTRVLNLRCETALKAYTCAVNAYHDRLNSPLARHFADRLGFEPVFDPEAGPAPRGIEAWGVSALATRPRDAA